MPGKRREASGAAREERESRVDPKRVVETFAGFALNDLFTLHRSIGKMIEKRVAKMYGRKRVKLAA